MQVSLFQDYLRNSEDTYVVNVNVRRCFWAKMIRDECALFLSGNLFSAHTICVFVTSYFKMFSHGRKISNLNQKCTKYSFGLEESMNLMHCYGGKSAI